jgi:hypothetical protein
LWCGSEILSVILVTFLSDSQHWGSVGRPACNVIWVPGRCDISAILARDGESIQLLVRFRSCSGHGYCRTAPPRQDKTGLDGDPGALGLDSRGWPSKPSRYNNGETALGSVRYRLARFVQQHQSHVAALAVALRLDGFEAQAPRCEIERLPGGSRDVCVNQLAVKAHDAAH